MSITRRRRTLLSVTIAVLLGAATGCASTQGPVNLAPAGSNYQPSPRGVQIGDKGDPDKGPQPDCGDPTASLRPGGLPAPGAMPSGSTMAKIQQRGYLIAGVDQDTYLFGYRNPSTGDIEGFDIDMVHNIADAIFGDPTRVHFKVINSDQRISALQNHDVDVVARTMSINCERRQQVDFSAVYYQAEQKLLVAGNSRATTLADLRGRPVCATKGSTSLSTIAKNNAKPVSVPDWSDCLVMVQQDQVDAVSTDDTILAGMIAQDPNLRIVGGSLGSEPYGIGIPKGEEDLVRFVNGVLVKIQQNGEWRNSYVRWLSKRLAKSAKQPTPTYSD